jgi:hypothetical protein
MAGEPDASSVVASDVERRAAGGDDGRGAAAASSGGALEVVRVAGAPVDEVRRLERERQLRRVGLAEEDRARVLHALHHGRVFLWDERSATARPARAHDALGVERVLDGHRHAVEGTSGLSAGESLIRLARAGERFIGHELNDGIELSVDGFDAIEAGPHRLLRGDRLVPDRGREVRDAGEIERAGGGGRGRGLRGLLRRAPREPERDARREKLPAGEVERLHGFASFTALVSAGTISKRSPTTPTSATPKMGASASLLMATM